MESVKCFERPDPEDWILRCIRTYLFFVQNTFPV